MIRLSICIATMNRASLLRETLQSFLAQISPDLEIVLVDGGSVDETPAVVAELQRSTSAIRYERLAEKGGVDQDFFRAVQLARGEYCWLFSDDDLIKPGALQRVIQAIDQKHSLIVVNAELRNTSLTRTLVPNRAEISEDRVYQSNDHERLFTDTAFYLSFIGGVVIRRDVWLERNHDRYAGTEFAHIGIIFQEPLPGTALLIAEPFITIRHGNAAWSSRTFEIWMFKWPDLVWSFSNFSETARRRVYRPEPWRNPITLAQYRAIGAYDHADYDRHLASRLRPIARGIAKLIAVTPARLMNLASVLYCHLTGSTMALDTLRNSRVYFARRGSSG